MRTHRPGPQDRATAVPWRQWLLPLGATAGILALLVLSQGSPPGPPLSYSRFLAEVSAGAVRAVTIGPAGQVAGTLATGQPFTTIIPVALDDPAPSPGGWQRTTFRSARPAASDRAQRARPLALLVPRG
jgi:hypothetical protein